MAYRFLGFSPEALRADVYHHGACSDRIAADLLLVRALAVSLDIIGWLVGLRLVGPRAWKGIAPQSQQGDSVLSLPLERAGTP